MNNLEKAICIAARAHAGQVDKAGAPYILHPLRLMLRMDDPAARIAAVLHDVVEDSPWTLEQLRAEGFPSAVVQAVDALTRRDGETYDAFIHRASRDPVAPRVKMADLEDNMDLGRIASPTERDYRRLERYRRAHAHLTEKLNAGER